MKKLITLLFLFNIYASWGQDNDIFSYYFHQNSFRVLNDVKQFDQEKYGRYELKETPKNSARVAAGDWMVIDETGMYLEKNKLMTITKEEVRENSQYNVRNGWLHGVMDNDSLPCKLEEDVYYFLIPYKTYLYDPLAPPSKLVKVSRSSYAIFSFEDIGSYSIVQVDFTAGGFDMNEVELTRSGIQSIDNIETKEELADTGDGLKTFILNPSKQEWNAFIFAKCMVTYDSYHKLISE
jgi:hypothetical protein